MDKIIKIVLILTGIFFLVILWAGPKHKNANLPKPAVATAPPAPRASTVQSGPLSPEQLNKIDQMLSEIEARQKTLPPSEAKKLEDLKRTLKMIKARGRLLSPQELNSK